MILSIQMANKKCKSTCTYDQRHAMEIPDFLECCSIWFRWKKNCISKLISQKITIWPFLVIVPAIYKMATSKSLGFLIVQYLFWIIMNIMHFYVQYNALVLFNLGKLNIEHFKCFHLQTSLVHTYLMTWAWSFAL